MQTIGFDRVSTPRLVQRVSLNGGRWVPPRLPALRQATHPGTGSSRAGSRLSCSQSPEASGDDEVMHPSSRKPLKFFNELTKWVVSGAASATLFWRHDLPVVWCILGSLVNVAICKALKVLIKEQRPTAAAKQDHGMPSSHAQSLGYLSVYTAISLATTGVLGPNSNLLAGGILALAVFLAWLRVASGYHTAPQVVVGYSLGVGVSLVWRHVGMEHVLPNAQGWPAVCIYTGTALAVLAFAAKNLLGAKKDVERLKLAIQ